MTNQQRQRQQQSNQSQDSRGKQETRTCSSNNVSKADGRKSLPIGVDERCCANCRYLLWAIGVGQGLRCLHAANRTNPDLTHKGFAPILPSRWYVCGDFERKATAQQNGPALR